MKKNVKRYAVRTREYEKKNWKVVASFDTEREATRFCIRSEYACRRNFDKMYDHWDVKDMETGERTIYA